MNQGPDKKNDLISQNYNYYSEQLLGNIHEIFSHVKIEREKAADQRQESNWDPEEPLQELRQRRQAICGSTQALQMQAKQRAQTERRNTIENAFFREFGLVDRMIEIRRCLSLEELTGNRDDALIDTQLQSMYYTIRTLREQLEEVSHIGYAQPVLPEQQELIRYEKKCEVLLRNMKAAGTADKRNLSILREEYRTLLEEYKKQLEQAEARMKGRIVNANAASAMPQDALNTWQNRLQEVSQLLGEPKQMDETQRRTTAKSLSAYVKAHFPERL